MTPRMPKMTEESGITNEWLETILRVHLRFSKKEEEDCLGPLDNNGSPDEEKDDLTVKVINFHISLGCREGENLLSDLYAIDVHFSVNEKEKQETKSLNLMIKLLPQDPYCRRFVCEGGFDIREIHFYTTLAPVLTNFAKKKIPDFQLPVPKCYYAKYQSGSESVLVLDNLNTLDFGMADFGKGLSLEQAISAVKAIAKIHGTAIAYKHVEDIDFISAFPFLFRPDAAAVSYEELIDRGLPALSCFLRETEVPNHEEVIIRLERLQSSARDILTELLAPDTRIATITHTDFWSNNIFFREDCDDSLILDWQMVTYSRPSNDLALLFLTSLDSTIRRNHKNDLVEIYWRYLTKTTSSLGFDLETSLNYAKDDFLEELKKSELLGLLLGIGSVDLALGDSRTESRLLDALNDLCKENVF
ncbi:uncharacterized protein LOC136036419 isoform X2 [Artemia franciscana]|uniref:uncharacterized protein LOC136036419 isoform X2 n=1 Tax=Artemia franciscana TaxID=6661 RepID=UPI0032DAB556